MTQRIQRFAPVQTAKVLGILYVLLGVIILIPAWLLASVFGPDGFGFGLGFGLLPTLMLPVFYGLIGAVGGALGSVIYNLLASWVGGIEIQLTSSGTETMQGEATR